MDSPDSSQPRPSSDLPHRSRPRIRRGGLVAVGAALSVTGLLTVAACSSHQSDADTSGASQSADVAARDGVALGSARAEPAMPRGVTGAADGGAKSVLSRVSAIDFDRAQIKTAAIGLRSRTITSVTTQIEGVANAQLGFVATENTVTDLHGMTRSSSITIRVPVDTFQTTITEISKLGQVASRQISTQDVTGRVADVASRVTSAKDSIAQLRVLFSHATKLSDIIALESELSQREADLESLLAQQRALTAATTLSTISVQVTLPPKPAVLAAHHDSSSGFVGGLKQGWQALADTFVAVSHGLGAALPLGLTILALVGLLWVGVRRLPRRHVEVNE